MIPVFSRILVIVTVFILGNQSIYAVATSDFLNDLMSVISGTASTTSSTGSSTSSGGTGNTGSTGSTSVSHTGSTNSGNNTSTGGTNNTATTSSGTTGQNTNQGGQNTQAGRNPIFGGSGNGSSNTGSGQTTVGGSSGSSSTGQSRVGGSTGTNTNVSNSNNTQAGRSHTVSNGNTTTGNTRGTTTPIRNETLSTENIPSTLNSAGAAPKCTLPKIQSIIVKEDETKSVIRWGEVVGASSYDIYKRSAQGNFTFVERVKTPSYTIYLSPGNIRYDYFQVAPVCADSGTVSPNASGVTRVRTGPEFIVLIIIAFGCAYFLRKKYAHH